MKYGQSTLLYTGNGFPASADGVPQYKVGGVTIDWNTVPLFADTNVINNPIVGPEVNFDASVSSASIPAGTYNVGYSYANKNGETQVSPLTQLTTTATGGLQVIVPEMPYAATGIKVYISTNGTPATANEWLQTMFGPNQMLAGQQVLPFNEGRVLALLSSGSNPVTGNSTGTLAGTAEDTLNSFGAQGNTIPFDDTVVPPGVKYLPFGLILAREAVGGLYGPYDAGAADGRQNLNRGSAFVLNYSTLQNDAHADNAPGVFEGGRVFSSRLRMLSNGQFVQVAPFAPGTSLAGVIPAAILAAFPGIRFVDGG